MYTLRFDLSRNDGKFKLLNATNGGPIHKRHATDQYRSNFQAYKDARIPYSRNHDSGNLAVYGGPYSHDISKIFRDFDADENDPKSYDFACTDESILVALETGTKTFFRLGETIEHQIKKHATLPPKDYAKWARICEHVVRHYTEGWADGFYHDMPYWEIWNEPDLDEDDSKNKRTWGGTKAEFFEFYATVAKHLKKCFPHLKFGGPSLAWRTDWLEDFLAYMQQNEVPLDFLSWHRYIVEPTEVILRSNIIHNLLVKYGYPNAESVFNEWNYIKGWSDEYMYSLETMRNEKGASLIMSTIICSQHAYVDMCMYYDTRPSVFNGVFDYYSLKPFKGYYALKWYGDYYDLEREVLCENEIENVYTLCGVDKDGKAELIIAYYSDKENLKDKEIEVDFGKKGNYEIYVVDKQRSGELVKTTEALKITMKHNSFVKIKEI